MKPGDRIAKVMSEHVFPDIEGHGFKYLKSTKEFKKRGDFFDYHISWQANHNNHGNIIAAFDLWIGVTSPKYRRWEKGYYDLEKNHKNSIHGNTVYYMEEWKKNLYQSRWYDLAKNDNEGIVDEIQENILSAAFKYFDRFSSLEAAILVLKESPRAHFFKIIDFYILQGKWEEAYEFFYLHKPWFDNEKEEGSRKEWSYYEANLKVPLGLRRKKLNNWVQQNLKPN
jgi:hypothetical protein